MVTDSGESHLHRDRVVRARQFHSERSQLIDSRPHEVDEAASFSEVVTERQLFSVEQGDGYASATEEMDVQ